MFQKVCFLLLCIALHTAFYYCSCEPVDGNKDPSNASVVGGIIIVMFIVIAFFIMDDSANKSQTFINRISPSFLNGPKIVQHTENNIPKIQDLARVVEIIKSAPKNNPENMRPIYQWIRSLSIEDLRVLQRFYKNNSNNQFFDKSLLLFVKEVKDIKEIFLNCYEREAALASNKTDKSKINDKLEIVFKLIDVKPVASSEKFQVWAKNITEEELKALKEFNFRHPGQRLFKADLIQDIIKCKEADTLSINIDDLACSLEEFNFNHNLIFIVALIAIFCFYWAFAHLFYKYIVKK